MARPIVAFGRDPGPSTFEPVFIPRRVRIGPLTTIQGDAKLVVLVTPCGLKRASSTARAAASTTGQ